MTSQNLNSGVLEKDQLTPKPLKIKKSLRPSREEYETTATLSISTILSGPSAMVHYSGTQAAQRSSLISLINEICEMTQSDYPDNEFANDPAVSPTTAPSQHVPATLTVRKIRRSPATSLSGSGNAAVKGSDDDTNILTTAVVLDMQSSYKLRNLNRLAIGFDPMIPTSGMPSGDSCECRKPNKHSDEVHDAQSRSGNDRNRTPAKLRCATKSDSSFRSSSESDLGSMIAAFPRPPNSFFKIGDSQHTTPTLTNAAQTALERYQPARLPNSDKMSTDDAKVVCVRLTLVPDRTEVVTADLLGGITFLVAVEIEGVVNHISKDIYQPLEPHQLDLAVVIDNSLYTSPAALMSACESVTTIAHNLTANSDRFALFQTSSGIKDSGSTGRLLSLAEPNLWNLKHILDNLEVCSEVPEPNFLGETIAVAQSHLRSFPRALSTNNHGKETIQHIIVFTSRPHTVTSTYCSEESIGVHVICAGSLPYMSEKPLVGDGWYMDYQPTYRELSTFGQLKDERRLGDRFRHLIWMLRTSSVPGVLSGLELFFHGGRFCRIKKIIGPVKFTTLRAGEVVKTVVKIHMSAPEVDTDKISDLPHGSLNPSKHDNLTGILDGGLEDKMITILGVKLRYTHSLLSDGTICHAKSEARIKVVSSPLQQRNDKQSQESVTLSEDLKPEAALVHKTLMYQLATTYTPASAIKLLLEQFGTSVGLSICPEYLMLLIAELKYQDRVASRIGSFGININDREYQGCTTTKCRLTLSTAPRASLRPERWLHRDIDQFPEQDQRATVELVTNPPRRSFELPRKYWHEIRSVSKGSVTAIMGLGRTQRSARVVEAQRRIQELASMNGRSIGQESLDEMVYDAAGNENFPSWL
ncbi:hypothetical protein MMC26_004002 [Xylographa opegraphella]|nr:hypothetical protein [Xylographa opegraphella]